MNNFLTRIFSTIWAIERSSADAHLPLIINAYKGIAPLGNAEEIRANSMRIGFVCAGTPYMVSNYGENVPLEKAPKNSVAVINITDTIYKNDMYCGPAGMKTKANLLQRCDANPNIIGMVLNIETPGGEGYAAQMMNGVIKNTKKPIVAFVEDLCASAGMYIASACDHVIANDTHARVGSIGTYATIADYAKMLEMEGITIMEVYADKSKDKNQDYIQAVEYMNSDGKKGSIAGIKEMVNKFNERFLSDVKENRDSRLTAKESEWGTGKLFFADDAVKMGLIDGIDTLENVIAKFF